MTSFPVTSRAVDQWSWLSCCCSWILTSPLLMKVTLKVVHSKKITYMAIGDPWHHFEWRHSWTTPPLDKYQIQYILICQKPRSYITFVFEFQVRFFKWSFKHICILQFGFSCSKPWARLYHERDFFNVVQWLFP